MPLPRGPLGRAVIVWCAVFGCVALCPSAAGAQISPGPLARAHAALEGPRNCAQCHGGRSEPTTQRCLACHREIDWLQKQGSGFHARRDARGTCSSCHPDHAGRDFQLIQWPGGAPERFDHARGTGFALEQSHATAKCTACHTSRLRVSPAAKLSPRRTSVGWVGLERDCSSCHRDPHGGTLDGACTRCHDAGKWKDAPSFDHTRSNYPLTGKHRDVTCAKCHASPRLRPATDSLGRLVPVFRPVPLFKDCSSCHTDPHRGRLRGACSSCHVTSSFASIDRAGFDHERTRYPLKGQHAAVACASCHAGFPTTVTRPAFATCASCHKDPHDGEATLAGKSVDCAACHRVEGFTPATFTLDQHQRTAFPLVGRHVRVACSACHTARSSATGASLPPPGVAKVPARPAATARSKTIPVRPASGSCNDCHVDAHGAQLAALRDRGACSSCHAVDGWKPSTFGAPAHASLRVSLDGAHAGLTCGACHGPGRRGLRPLPDTSTLGTARVALRPPETTCAQCHADPHAWRVSSAAAPACVTCHTTRAFRPAAFDAASHSATGYALEGAHRAVPCVSCHKSMERARPQSTLVAATPALAPLDLGSAPAVCSECHVDPHGGQFKADGVGSCDGCHTMNAFSPASRFDHARVARFPLEGAHARLQCVSCHRQPSGAKPGAPLTYRGLSASCESCHAATRGRPRGRP